MEEYDTDVVVPGGVLDRGMIPNDDGLTDGLLCVGLVLKAVTILSDETGLTTVVIKLLPYDEELGDLVDIP